MVNMFNSRLYDVTSIERYVGQSTVQFIFDAVSHVNHRRSSLYEPSWPQKGSYKAIAGECIWWLPCMIKITAIETWNDFRDRKYQHAVPTLWFMKSIGI